MNQYRSVPLLSSILSEKERVVLAHLCNGWQTAQIADFEEVSKTTVYSVRSKLLRKLGVHHTAHLISVVKKAEIHYLRQLLQTVQGSSATP